MKRSMCSWMFAVSVIFYVLIGIVSEANAGLILNGSFETASVDPDSDPGKIVQLPNGNEINDWTAPANFTWYVATPATFLFLPAGNGNALDGTRFVNVTGSNAISQSFSVAGGSVVDVSYWEKARNQNTAILTATITLAAGVGTTTTGGVTGSGTATLSQNANSPFGPTWVQYIFQFTPSVSTTATLTFTNIPTSGGGSNTGTFLDLVDVSQVATPEPNGLSLLAIGSVVLGLVKRRRQG